MTSSSQYATNRRILEEQLAGWGMRPTLADSGTAALALLQRAVDEQAPFGLIILDAHMPVHDGFEVAALIQQASTLAGTTRADVPLHVLLMEDNLINQRLMVR